jgi:hypothetical protein
MPSWGDIGKEIHEESKNSGSHAHDRIRRKYLHKLFEKTGRPVIIYAVKMQPSFGVDSSLLMINDEDIQGMMEVLCGIPEGNGLDLIIHSPGGSAESAEAIVKYLRSKFSDIRVFIPISAMSAATMIACSANRIVMGKHSFIGPIDPQMVLATPLGNRMIPAQAILDQFSRAQKECQNPRLLTSWLPMLQQFGPALLQQCQEAIDLSLVLVSEWLEKYMFSEQLNAKEKGEKAAKFLGNHSIFLSHGRHIDREMARNEIGLTVEYLEDDQDIQDLVLSVFHATTRTFDSTGAVKIIENHNEKAFIKMVNVVITPQPSNPPKPASK